ncbi:DUF4376 domain-containing protein [Citrobacter freundii]|uniref:DUF4376 domain-containing protein n=1 Tax=Citrobacter freundii TaxID=546 RepID=UPI0015E4E31E|nr:DUF4376 domain-containing protein [Citrobacter freundii]QLO44614.1 DUF4376 domain-containing protein [Citrobacter freundii]QLV42778.1 DUF4376 domain-containing protein [Citrobacter freundii]
MINFEFSDEPQILRVFNFLPDTLEFCGESDCYVAPGTGLPEYCTLDAPPTAIQGKTAVWHDSCWQFMEDHRGMVVYDTLTRTELVIAELGVLPERVTMTKPTSHFDYWNGDVWLPNIHNVKSAQIAAIKIYRDSITADYIIIDGNHFHSDANSRIQQMSLTRMGLAKQVPEGLMWQTKNNGLIALTNDIAAQFETVTMDHDMRLFANAQHHILAVEALEDIQAVQDYDYSTGWQP